MVFGAFGTAGSVALAEGPGGDRSVRSASADDIAIMLAYARRVVIVPGYGLAVAQAQHNVRELGRPAPEPRASTCATRSTRWRAGCPGT